MYPGWGLIIQITVFPQYSATLLSLNVSCSFLLPVPQSETPPTFSTCPNPPILQISEHIPHFLSRFSLLSQLIQAPFCAKGWQQVTPRRHLEPAWCVCTRRGRCVVRGRERGGRGGRGAHAWERTAGFVKFHEQSSQSSQVFTPRAGTPRWLSCHVVRSVGLEELTALWLME